VNVEDPNMQQFEQSD
jgi:hydroxymethylpyrimidine pyrophosphatase-like HAD family hydrolase